MGEGALFSSERSWNGETHAVVLMDLVREWKALKRLDL